MVSLPNLLTLVRLPLAALLWVRPGDAVWLLSIVAVAGATDVADGAVARALRRRLPPARRAQDQAVGAWLDPVCDKLFAVSMLGAVAVGFDVGLGVLALVLARELLLTPLVALYHLIPSVRETLHLDFSADWFGKLTTCLQFAAVGAVLLYRPAVAPLAVLAGLVGVVAAVHYVRRGIIAARIAARNPIGERVAKA